MKKALLISAIIFMYSCKDSNNEKSIESNTIEVVENDLKSTKNNIYPVYNPTSTNYKIIFDKGYSFSNDIKINAIGTLRNSEDSLDIIFQINDSTNLDRLEKLIIGSTFYPKNPELMVDPADQKKKIKRAQSKADIYNLDGDLVFKISNFTIKPKQFNKAQFWLYDTEGKVVEDNFLIIPAFSFE